MEHGFTLLHAAAYHSNFKAIISLLKFGADPNQVDYRGQTPLHIALRFNYCFKIVQLLAESTISHSVDNAMLTPLLLASMCGRP